MSSNSPLTKETPLKRIISAILVFFFVQTQSVARASQGNLNQSFNQMAHEVSQGHLTASEIIAKAKNIVTAARESGITEQEFIASLSEKMALNMSQEDINASIDELRIYRSELKIQEIAQSLENNQNGDKVFMVLLTFALLSLLWVGIFFILAGPHYPAR
jgi:hypothetical protein